MDDMRCGSAAGCDTCLIRPAPPTSEAPDGACAPAALDATGAVGFVIHSLAELQAMVDDALAP
eukprot:6251577-Prymnesium_polylepis.2